MNQRSKQAPRLRLDSTLYEQLRQEVLSRDRWRCQVCGSLAGVEVHHITPKGRHGDDTEENLITLCTDCHKKIHEHACR
jgi:5-methylcytosine-specific restriction endonuclease McrA